MLVVFLAPALTNPIEVKQVEVVESLELSGEALNKCCTREGDSILESILL